MSEIRGPGWRPDKVHPLAELFPALEPDDLDALAEDIKANGLLHPIVVDDEGILIDGRMRLAACERAGVEPEFERINGHDAEAFIWGANAKRRQMTKGALAMVAAVNLTFVAKARSVGGIDAGKAKAAAAAGVTPSRLSQALLVKECAPHLVDEVVKGDRTLDDAYRFAQAAKRAQETEAEKLVRLRKFDKELAQLVADREITLDDALKRLADRAQAEASTRDAVFLNIVNLAGYASTFVNTDVLAKVPEWLATTEGQRSQDKYFDGGAAEVLEKVALARQGLDAVEKVYRAVAGRRSRG